MPKTEKKYSITKIRHRESTPTVYKGTLPELVEAFSYTLECGASYSNEKGNKKINCNPATLRGLVTALNNAVNNSAANGYAGVTYKGEALV